MSTAWGRKCCQYQASARGRKYCQYQASARSRKYYQYQALYRKNTVSVKRVLHGVENTVRIYLKDRERAETVIAGLSKETSGIS